MRSLLQRLQWVRFRFANPLLTVLLAIGVFCYVTIGVQSQELAGLSISIPTPPARTELAQVEKRIQVIYSNTKRPFPKELERIYQKTQVFEKLSGLIDNKINLPRNVRVILKECGVTNAFYRPSQHSITICYDLTEYFIDLFKKNGKTDYKAGEMAMYATVFTFFHEVGHMLTSELDLPITGKEEDAADQFSTLLLSKSDVGERSALAAASWFNYATGPTTRAAFMDEHSLDQQRLYYIVCLLYGDEPKKYTTLVQGLGFPRNRLSKCVKEYDQKTKAWRKLLSPYAKKGSLI
ncbi:hypothetical protein BST81_16345 [Leptolyngbya sp. 'hensonii']|uniref:DUF4344 domain-containing metallopeptidase n=1 Tax=Leptolyngbya sp. 'hensonii' TaxID=1922337 RepID=UPI00094F525F|nr:DUF4344 domain-containing metallopeptidase [Leptolyngbya sp. 'hensonii']OLP17369.1 hypothetical protein BST81_16345 [Leptolyngbya sp. 'hensonii']